MSDESGSNSAAVLAWTPLPDAVYAVCVQRDNTGRCEGGWWPVEGVSLRVAGLSPGTYYWQVMALTPSGNVGADGGGWSAFTIGGPGRPVEGTPTGTAKPRGGNPPAPNLAGIRRHKGR